MISFIIIGHNEGWKLSKCINSVKENIEYNKIKDTEIIFIDSDSKDNSIEIAENNNVDKIFKIHGNINAAIARNIGAKEATGDILFFLDGDIQLKPFKLDIISKLEKKLLYNYIVGFLDDVNYSSEWKFINQTPRSYKKVIKDINVTTVGGGIFIIEKATWNQFNGMDERLKRTQDRDLSLRLAKKGLKGIRKSEIFGLHHTIPYNDNKRMWQMLFKGSINYKGVMIRKHLTNPAYLPKFIHEEWTIIVLITSLLLLFVTPYSFLLYFIAISVKNRKQIKRGNFKMIIYRILQDVVVVF